MPALPPTTPAGRNCRLGLLALGVILCTVLGAPVPAAPLGTAWTYQGRLMDGGTPASGLYDFVFELDDPNLNEAGASGVNVSNGVFTVTLDFPADLWNGEARCMTVYVRTNGASTYRRLDPCQPIMPTPYAIYAPSAGTALVAATASAVAPGGVDASALQEQAVTGTAIADGTIGPADLATATFNGTFWKTDGNSGTTPGTHFLGTTDEQPLELRVAGQRALRLEPHASVWRKDSGSVC